MAHCQASDQDQVGPIHSKASVDRLCERPVQQGVVVNHNVRSTLDNDIHDSRCAGAAYAYTVQLSERGLKSIHADTDLGV